MWHSGVRHLTWLVEIQMSQHELVLSPRKKYILYSITANAMPAQRVSVASMEAIQRISKHTTPTAPLHVTCPLLSVICP